MIDAVAARRRPRPTSGSTVTLTVSTGPGTAPCPPVQGLTEAAAEQGARAGRAEGRADVVQQTSSGLRRRPGDRHRSPGRGLDAAGGSGRDHCSSPPAAKIAVPTWSARASRPPRRRSRRPGSRTSPRAIRSRRTVNAGQRDQPDARAPAPTALASTVITIDGRQAPPTAKVPRSSATRPAQRRERAQRAGLQRHPDDADRHEPGQERGRDPAVPGAGRRPPRSRARVTIIVGQLRRRRTTSTTTHDHARRTTTTTSPTTTTTTTTPRSTMSSGLRGRGARRRPLVRARGLARLGRIGRRGAADGRPRARGDRDRARRRAGASTDEPVS